MGPGLREEEVANAISKVQKLLALAGSSDEHEAKAARQKAQELIDKHQIPPWRVAVPLGTASPVYTAPSSTTPSSTTPPASPPLTSDAQFGYSDAIDAGVLVHFPGRNKKTWVVDLCVLLGYINDCIVWASGSSGSSEAKILAAGHVSDLKRLHAAVGKAIEEVEATVAAHYDPEDHSEAQFRLGATHALVNKASVTKVAGFFKGVVQVVRDVLGVGVGKLEAVESWLASGYGVEDGRIVSWDPKKAHFTPPKITDEGSYDAGYDAVGLGG